jgi:hypothetical protein
MSSPFVVVPPIFSCDVGGAAVRRCLAKDLWRTWISVQNHTMITRLRRYTTEATEWTGRWDDVELLVLTRDKLDVVDL